MRKTRQAFITVAALSLLVSAALAQMTPPSSQNQPPVMDVPLIRSSDMPEGKQVEGTIKNVDQAKNTLTLDDGTTLAIPASVPIAPNALKKGARLRGTYEDRDGTRVLTSLQVEPPAKS